MKKLFAILAVAGILVACNDSGKTEESKAADTTTTPSVAAPAPDSAAAHVDSAALKVDSAAKAVDTTKK